MTQTPRFITAALLMLALVAAPSFAATAVLNTAGGQIAWSPDFAFDQADLVVAGPDGFAYNRTFRAGETPVFAISHFPGEVPAGSYNWTLTAVSKISPELRERLDAARAAGDLAAVEQLKADAGFQSVVLSGHFVYNGLDLIAPGSQGQEEALSTQDLPTKDQQILDDLIVDGSICVGQDCVNGESFGFDTLRLKENNLRIKAQDTSNSASFPTNDWQITFNDSSNGGQNKFSIDDIDGGRTPFTIEASAPSHSLYVDDGGRLGLGTSTPVSDIHVKSGNTPTLRLEQDGTSGFTPQIWDLAGNEANLFLRDATNGSTLPFRLYPDAPSNALTIEGSTGDIGVGTTSPDANVHIFEGTSNAQQVVLRLENNGIPSFSMEDISTTDAWTFSVKTDGFEISKDFSGKREMRVDPDGNLVVRGNLTVCTDGAVCTPQTSYPDYVFEEGYDLMPLDELKTFIAENKHLPKVPTVGDVTEEGINMTQLQLRLLEKVEELTLYTLSQQELIEQQGALIEELRKQLEK